jgi:hypothetical protein
MAECETSTEKLKRIVLWLTPQEIDTLVLMLKEQDRLLLAEYIVASLEYPGGDR